MKLGFIGLGRMGSSMVLNLLEHRIRPVVYNRSPDSVKKLAKKGAIPAYFIEELINKFPKQKVIWIMIKAGKPVDSVIKELVPFLGKGDIIIDGGNSFYKDSIRRGNELKKKGINFLDCGVSGGIEGARHGACMMIGGDKKVFKKVEFLFKAMCVKDGYGYMGNSGAGHFVKMVHNGIEYGMMGALNEGFETIEKYSKQFNIDLKIVSRVYNNGSIIEGKLSNWLWESFAKPKYLDSISCEVPTGETEKEMKHLEGISKMPVLKASRLMRVQSRSKQVCGRIVAALRNQFGGHKVKKK